MSKYVTVIGLEVHVQLDTVSKMFCRCPNEFGQQPNTLVCPVCMGLPGVLPVLNKRSLEIGLKTALALNCRIQKEIIFERKNYFYPDLPKGYQVSQYIRPLGEDGFIKIGGKKIGITRAHLEEDAGKLIHKKDYSLVDLNRTGVPLLEIVSSPDIENPQQAYDYLRELKLILQYIGASGCDMEKGFLRCDANISLKEPESDKLGVKTELKNMNSFKQVKDALSYEVVRQEKVLLKGGKILQETRLWDADKKKSIVMRTKEEAHDYRYFPEPDLVYFTISQEKIDKERANMVELPSQKKERLSEKFSFSDKDLALLLSDIDLSDFFESCYNLYDNEKTILNWIKGPLLGVLNETNLNIKNVNITPENFVKLVRMVDQNKITNLIAKDLLAEIVESGQDPVKIVDERGLTSLQGKDELGSIIEDIIKDNPQAVTDYNQGKDKAVMFLVGQVMRKTKGKANPNQLKDMFIQKLKKE